MITKDSDRQYPLFAVVDIAYSDFGASGVAEKAVELPSDAIVVAGGGLAIDTAFDSGTSDTLTVGDEDTDNLYASGINGQTVGFNALTPTGKELAGTKNVVVKWTGVGAAPSQGAGRLIVPYIRRGRGNENQG